ncbi:MAG: hypothetical protein FJW23_12090 [Acidimicrobiia bacterium]|nr:hypothetical protein [Acidimicrobiia bacterium]
MTRFALIPAVAMLVALPMAAEAQNMPGAQAAKGWKVRVDRSTSASDPDAAGAIQFMAHGPAFHAITPQAGVFWNPANTASGAYTLKGTFKLMKPSSHTNYYGLVFGGSSLEGANQQYLYFLVAQNGSYLIKQRTGDTTSNVVARTPNDAVAKPDGSGMSTNTLEVRVMADKVDYVVNGTVVASTPKSGATASTDGVYGFRVNHMLEVMVEDLGVSR